MNSLQRAATALALVVAGSCSNERAAPSRGVVGPAVARPLELRAPNEVVVDVSARGEAFVGAVRPAPEDSDGDRVLALRWLTREGERSWAFSHVDALEARFVPGTGAALVLTVAHELVRLDARGAHPVTLDRGVYGPLSLDALGRYVVYTRGEPPELAVVRAEVATGHTEALAPGLIPSWCPALSPDGQEVVVVASPEGTPSLWRLRAGAAPARWDVAAGVELPSGPTAPVVFGDALVFESDGALRAIGLDGSARRVLPGLRLPVYVPGSATLIAQRADGESALVTVAPHDLGAR